VQFEVEKEEETGKLKAVNVTNKDGTPIVPPPRERRRRQHKDEKKTEGNGAKEENADAAKASSGDEKKDDKPKKSRQPRKNRGKDKGKEGEAKAKPTSAPKDPPFHAALEEDVKKKMQEKGLELGKRTTVDVAVGDTRIKLGQGGYAGCALASAVVGEGTYTCDANGTVTFKWERCLECKDKAWKTGDPASLVSTISLADRKSS